MRHWILSMRDSHEQDAPAVSRTSFPSRLEKPGVDVADAHPHDEECGAPTHDLVANLAAPGVDPTVPQEALKLEKRV